MSISEAESYILRALWDNNPLSADEIHRDVGAQNEWTLATVKTLLNRLLKKGAIEGTKDGRRFLYTPLLAKEDFLTSESDGFLDRLFKGSFGDMAAHFSSSKRLTREDVAKLKAIIAELDDAE